MIAPYIIDRSKKEEVNNQIQLEIPDYTLEYLDWMQRNNKKQQEEQPDSVIVIDIY